MATAASERLEASTAYRLNIGELFARLATDEHRGLSEGEARSRLTHYGPNELAAEKGLPPWRRFLSQFQDVLVILLLVATGVSAALWAFERDAALPYEAIAIFAVVLLNAGGARDHRAHVGRHRVRRGNHGRRHPCSCSMPPSRAASWMAAVIYATRRRWLLPR